MFVARSATRSTFMLVLAGALAACATTQPALRSVAPERKELSLADLKGQRVLFVAHPRPHIFQSLRAVRAAGLLPATLHIVGVYHAREREDYGASRRYLAREKLAGFDLLRLTCKLEAGDVFKANACTPIFKALVQRAAGVLFPGGADIPPALYGQKTLLTTVLDTPERQYWELSFMAHLLGTSRNAQLAPLLAQRKDLAVLGICMGMQAMNVATGGTLHQDIPSQLYGVKTLEELAALPADQRHRSALRPLHPERRLPPGVYHGLRFSGAPALWKRLAPDGKTPRVLSVHHQALDQVGLGLEIIATSVDGKVAEAVRHKAFPKVLAVQFHPEYFYLDRAMVKRKGAKAQTIGPLAGAPESLAFHRAIWQLFAERLKAAGSRTAAAAAAR